MALFFVSPPPPKFVSLLPQFHFLLLLLPTALLGNFLFPLFLPTSFRFSSTPPTRPSLRVSSPLRGLVRSNSPSTLISFLFLFTSLFRPHLSHPFPLMLTSSFNFQFIPPGSLLRLPIPSLRTSTSHRGSAPLIRNPLSTFSLKLSCKICTRTLPLTFF